MEVERKDEFKSPSTISPSSFISPRWQASIPTPCERTKVVQRHPESLTLLPISWDVILSIYRELVRLISRLPFKKKLIVCIVFKGSKFRFDLGEVKAAGVVCLIGLGLSLGTLLLYRLYFRIIVPFLHNVWAAKGKNSLLDDEYTLYLESYAIYDDSIESDSEVDDKMGNSNSKKSTPSVYYSPGYGVALGSRPSSIDVDHDGVVHDKGVRLRQRKPSQLRTKSPSPASDKDSAIGVGGSEMSQSFYSENSANRDSFYSTCTAESGFDDFGFLDDLKNSKLSGSLKENFSPSSLIERNLQMLYRAHHGYDAGLNSIGRNVKPTLDTLSDCSSEKSGILSSRSFRSSCDGDSCRRASIRTNIDPLMEKLVSENGSGVRTSSRGSQGSFYKTSLPSRRSEGPSDSVLGTALGDSEPTVFSPKMVSGEPSQRHRSAQHRGRGNSPFRVIHHQQPHNRQTDWLYGEDPNLEYDPSLDVSESIRSFNSSADEIDWDGEEDSRDRMSAVPHFQQSLSDLQFKQSLMQRIHEWSNFADEYNKSRSPTPDCYPVRFVRRSRSLDRHIGDPSLILVSDPAESKPIEIEPTVERNLETLEYELHDIQGEFESITCKLHELIEQSSADEAAAPKSSKQFNSTVNRGQRAASAPRTIEDKHLRKMRTQWDHVSSSACSDSSRSSRASSVEYAWDLGDYRHNLAANIAPGDRPRAGSRSEGADMVRPPSRGTHMEDTFNHTSYGASTINIGLPVIISDYAEQEWKGDTEKSRTIREGYNRIPQLFSCYRICVTRGDNYCGLRSVLFQILVNGQRANQCWSGVIRIMDSLHDLYNDPAAGLSEWTFANRLPSHCKDKLASLSKCALSLYATIEEVCNLTSREEREHRTIGLFNTSSTFDLELMEGLKIMMLLTLVGLKRQMEDGDDVPLFVHLLFARDTSETVSAFLKNHLNCVGDTGGVEQVEMCLLGYTLGVRIRLLHLAQCGQEDFECVLPDDVPADWAQVGLIVEDGRHYNVPLP